jgi:hypothetical protein
MQGLEEYGIKKNMATYKIQVPFHASHRIQLETFTFEQEREAIDTLTNYLTQNGIDFKIKQVLKRKASGCQVKLCLTFSC